MRRACHAISKDAVGVPVDAPDLAGDWQVGGSLRRDCRDCTDLPQGRLKILKCACILAHHLRGIVCLSNSADPSLPAVCFNSHHCPSFGWRFMDL